MNAKKKIIICGAGIAGIATAYYLTKLSSNLSITLIDKQQPLAFTSSKSGENFRDYWPESRLLEVIKSIRSYYFKVIEGY